jgi:Flp pilus assembly protein TadG
MTLKIQNNESVAVEQDGTLAGHFLAQSDKRGRNRLLTAGKALVQKGERGSALVEMAVTLPILFVILTGIFSFSIALYQKLELAQAVSTGSRFLATDRGDTDPCASTATKVYAAAPGLTPSSMTFNFGITGTSGTTATYTTPTCSGAVMNTGGSAQLKITYPCTLQVYGMKFSSCSLSTAVTEVIQ